MRKILVTGCSGFIGMHLCRSLLSEKYDVLGIDNMNSYYSVSLKNARLKQLKKYKNFHFRKADITDIDSLKKIFKIYKPYKVVNLAAQAGVRYSLSNPQTYVQTNILGFVNILECCSIYNVRQLVYASSSSVYGANTHLPFSTLDRTDSPISVYAVSKKSNELLANVYSHIKDLNSIGLRFFTAYGPWGRPDMAIYIFTKSIIAGKTISLFNHGEMIRDFTYIDDIVTGIRSSIASDCKNEVFNLGSQTKVNMKYVISIIEKKLGKKAIVRYVDIQPGDVKASLADIHSSQKKLNYKSMTSIEEGIPLFIDWYLGYKG